MYSLCQDVGMRHIHYVVVADSVGNEQWHCIRSVAIPGFFVMLKNSLTQHI
jgi:hypothetical protein